MLNIQRIYGTPDYKGNTSNRNNLGQYGSFKKHIYITGNEIMNGLKVVNSHCTNMKVTNLKPSGMNFTRRADVLASCSPTGRSHDVKIAGVLIS